MEVFSKILEVLTKTIGLAVEILTAVKIHKELQEKRKTAPSSRLPNPRKRRR